MALQRIHEAGLNASQPATAAPVGRGPGNRPSKAGVVDLGGLQCGAIGRVPVARRRYRVGLPAPSLHQTEGTPEPPGNAGSVVSIWDAARGLTT